MVFSIKFTPRVFAIAALSGLFAFIPQSQALNLFETKPSSEKVAFVDSGSEKETVNLDDSDYNLLVNQGDRIYVTEPESDGFSGCTMGYVGDGYALTAAHCGKEGSLVVNEDHTLIGVVVFANWEDGQDASVINLKESVGGENIYSGDYITSIAELKPEDTLCQYGSTTKEVRCSPVTNLARNGRVWSNALAERGDSGGAMWVKDKGLIAIINHTTFKDTDGSEAFITVEKHPYFSPPMADKTASVMSIE